MTSEPARGAVPVPGEAAERCPHCLQTYVIEIGAWCVACDEPICPLCTVEVRGETWCPACHAEEG